MRAILVLMLIWISSCQILEDLKGAIKNGIKINDQTRIHFGNSNRPDNMPGPGFPGGGAEIRHQPNQNTQYVLGGFGSK